MIRPSPDDLPDFLSQHPKASSMRYQTEIFVASDRYVCLQLPDYLPEGKAVVTIFVEGVDDPGPGLGNGDDPDRHDIEWWDEFDDEEAGRPS